MAFNLTGTIRKISPAETKNNFTKQAFTVEYAENPNYPQLLQLECSQQRCDLLDNLKAGDEVEISFNLKGREWTSPSTGKTSVFMTLDVWKMQKVGAAPAAQPQKKAATYPTAADLDNAVGDEDLPF